MTHIFAIHAWLQQACILDICVAIPAAVQMSYLPYTPLAALATVKGLASV